MQLGDPENSDAAKVGFAFARALASGEYDVAHTLLAAELRDDLQPSDLETHFEEMTSYWSGPAEKIEVYVDAPASEPPGKDARDVGWAYVSIASNSLRYGRCLEAVFVRVVRDSGRNLIAQVEWGRP